MKLSQARIGLEFHTAEGRLWRITDVGTRTFLAIVIGEPDTESGLPRHVQDPIWLDGPPYLVKEHLFDETSMGRAFLTIPGHLQESLDADRHHPGFDSTLSRVMGYHTLRRSHPDYPFPKVLKHDRWDEQRQDVLHPYLVDKTARGWSLRTLGLFSRRFYAVDDQAFVRLPRATTDHFRAAGAAHGWGTADPSAPVTWTQRPPIPMESQTDAAAVPEDRIEPPPMDRWRWTHD